MREKKQFEAVSFVGCNILSNLIPESKKEAIPERQLIDPKNAPEHQVLEPKSTGIEAMSLLDVWSARTLSRKAAMKSINNNNKLIERNE